MANDASQALSSAANTWTHRLAACPVVHRHRCFAWVWHTV